MAKVIRVKKQNTDGQQSDSQFKPVSDDAMAQLARIMNDSPSIIKLHGTQWEITGLKPAVQMLIAEEACKVVDGENKSMGDVLKEFSTNLPCVVKCLTLAMLNDKDRIYKDFVKKTFSDEYQAVYDTLMWGDYDVRDWAQILYEVLTLINTDFFFESSNVIKTVRKMTLERKMTRAEAGL